MEFNKFHKAHFSAIKGAYSKVTNREYEDSQVTLTDLEAEIVTNYFGKNNIHVGKKGLNPELSSKVFFLYPDLRPIALNLVFPKLNKSELRLYLAGKQGYKPKGGEISFIYINDQNMLVIGSMDEKNWNLLGQDDTEDEKYQQEIEEALRRSPNIPQIAPEGKISIFRGGPKIIYRRNPQIALVRFYKSDHKCEIDPTHTTFIAEKTNLPYLEAHHFIPMKFQRDFNIPLDTFDNVTSLCPTCHRGIHLGVTEHRQFLIKSLYDLRPELHEYNFEQIAQYYNCFRVQA